MTNNPYHDWYELHDKLFGETNPNAEELKLLFNQKAPIDEINLRGLRLKKQIHRFQKYFNVVEEIHTITHNAIETTDETLSNALKEKSNLHKTFAKTNREWYRHKNQKKLRIRNLFRR